MNRSESGASTASVNAATASSSISTRPRYQAPGQSWRSPFATTLPSRSRGPTAHPRARRALRAARRRSSTGWTGAPDRPERGWNWRTPAACSPRPGPHGAPPTCCGRCGARARACLPRRWHPGEVNHRVDAVAEWAEDPRARRVAENERDTRTADGRVAIDQRERIAPLPGGGEDAAHVARCAGDEPRAAVRPGLRQPR